MPQYKLTYFNIKGLGEPVRFMLSYGGVDFEDVRYAFDEWPKHKSEMPFGQVPVLEIDGKQYCQSMALGRFLAKKFNLYGSDEFEALEIDQTTDSINDMRKYYFWIKNVEEKAKQKEVVMKEKVPFYLKKFEAQLEKNGGYFVGGKLSWADIFFASFSEYMSFIKEEDIAKDTPNLKKLVEKVMALPSIKAYIEKRPESQF